MKKRLLTASLLVWLSGCSDSAPTSPAPPAPPTPAFFVVSGTLFETVDGTSRPLAARQVRLLTINAQIEKEDAYFTDDNGHYTARASPGSRVFAYARDTTGPWQPCLASAVVNRDTSLDVHVVPQGNSLLPPPGASPLITGFVYETTAQGRRPLRGVVAWLEAGVNSYGVAVTQTDEGGRFFLCRANAPVWMGVSSRQEWFQLIPGTGDSFFEIELRR
jgi:hypothetical protein